MIGRRELKGRQLAARDPPHRLALLRGRLALELTAEEVQLDAAFWIGVDGGQNFGTDRHIDPELFAHLADETGCVSFSRLALTTGEFPVSLQVHARRPPRDQKRIVPLDHGGGDEDRVHESGVRRSDLIVRQPFAIGQARHFGLRATQIIAPKSISA